jgi:hypothetical protein
MIFCFNRLCTEGFSAGTMVKVPHGYARIEYLQKGDSIICLGGGIWKLFDKTGERIATVNIDLTKVIGT